jgi:hypothetical protein
MVISKILEAVSDLTMWQLAHLDRLVITKRSGRFVVSSKMKKKFRNPYRKNGAGCTLPERGRIDRSEGIFCATHDLKEPK